VDCTPIILAHEQPFRIGDAEIRPATRELEFAGRTAILEPRVMQVLVALHQAKGGVVSKDDLVMSCWDGRIVGDDAINRVIGRLRHDASDHAGDAFRIETITRVGYRLVESGGSAALDRRRLVIGGTAAAAVAAVGVIGWRELSHPQLRGEAESLVDQAGSALREGQADQIGNAVSKLRKASELAPQSAEVWGLLALAYRFQIQLVPSAQQTLLGARAKAAAARALAIDPNDGNALAANVWAPGLSGNWLAFEKAARNALQRSGNHIALNRAMGFFLSQVGRLREALDFYGRVLREDPLQVFPTMFRIELLWDLSRLEQAERALEAAYRLWPRHYAIWFSRFYFLTFNGRPQDALAMIADEGGRPVGIPGWNLDLTKLQAEAIASGDSVKIDNAVARWREAARAGTGFAENAIIFSGRMNRIDTAFELLQAYFFDRGFRLGDRRWSQEQGVYARRSERYTYMLFRRGMESLRRDPRFAELVRAIGLADYWHKSRSRPDYLA